MPDTEDLAIFVRVVELGSLSAAGRDMRLSAAVVSNRIARLEKDVGTRLLNRTTRHVSLTEDGSRYYEHCVVILNELEQAESALDAITAEPRGPIKVTVPTVFGRLHIAPHIPLFLEKHPQMQVRLHLTDMLVDLIQERIDLAIRIAELSDSTAIVRKLANNRRLIVAAPDTWSAAARRRCRRICWTTIACCCASRAPSNIAGPSKAPTARSPCASPATWIATAARPCATGASPATASPSSRCGKWSTISTTVAWSRC